MRWRSKVMRCPLESSAATQQPTPAKPSVRKAAAQCRRGERMAAGAARCSGLERLCGPCRATRRLPWRSIVPCAIRWLAVSCGTMRAVAAVVKPWVCIPVGGFGRCVAGGVITKFTTVHLWDSLGISGTSLSLSQRVLLLLHYCNQVIGYRGLVFLGPGRDRNPEQGVMIR